MPQEVSISYQAVKSKVYKLIDAMVEGEKTEAEVRESMRRWWALIHPSDRAVAQKYLLTVLEKSYSSLGAMSLGQGAFQPFKPPARDAESTKLPKLAKLPRSERAQASGAV
jgi:uncharacterized protein (DUF2252 family)